MLRHYEALTLFLREPDMPLDNNLAERLLNLVVRGRNYVQRPVTRSGGGVRGHVPQAA